MKYILAIVAISLLAVATPADADILVYESRDTPYRISRNTTGIITTPGGLVSSTPSTSSYIRAVLDTDALSLTIAEMVVSFTGQRLSFSENVTLGLGRSETLEFDISLEPYTFRVQESDPVFLIPATGGDFTVSSFSNATFDADPLIFNYQVRGPTESVSGQSTALRFSNPSNNTLFIGSTLSTSGFPDTLLLDAVTINAAVPSPATTRITEGIEGGTLSFTASSSYVNVQRSGNDPIVFNLVPEPSSFILVSALLFSCLRQRFRNYSR